ncbi:MAG: DMT family transporter [Lachnospiraceae bacterium]|jgi:drug/metabolite transporter (DMT)-like permease
MSDKNQNQKSKGTRQIRGAVFALTGGLCWGISGSIGQYAFTHTAMQAEWLVPIRLFTAGIILMIWNLFRYGKNVFRPWTDRRDVLDLLIYSIPGIGFCQFLYFKTIQLSTAGTATILQDLSPIPILLFTCLKSRRRPKAAEILSIILALVGVFLITTHGETGSFSVSGAALTTGVLCALTVALYNIQPVRLLSRHPLLIVQSWAFLLSGALFLLVFRPWSYAYTPGPTAFLCIAGVVVIGNLLAFPIYMAGVTEIGGNKAILYGFMEPVSAAAIGTVFLGSPFTLSDAIGFGCVFAMLVLTSISMKSGNSG